MSAGSTKDEADWVPGSAPVAVLMISLNEQHNMEAVLENLRGWAQEVFLVDSYSQDSTVDVALRYGVHVVQRRFRDFGDQWNFALRELPILAPWTMKLDPDERLSDELKSNLTLAMKEGSSDGLSILRRLWFMERPLPIRQLIVRLWKTGQCRFADIAVNEHPIVDGRVVLIDGELQHHDSPDLDHWFEKQNRYTTAEAVISHKDFPLAYDPRLLGTSNQRRMWLKRNYRHVPMRHFLFFLYTYFFTGAFRSGLVGYVWARLRADVMRLIDYKRLEIELTGQLPRKRVYGSGQPDPRVPQFE